jgi:hypothetical protein
LISTQTLERFGLNKKCGPGVEMEKADHYKTDTWGTRNSTPSRIGAQAARDLQLSRLGNGEISEILMDEIANIQQIASLSVPGKYDNSLLQAIDSITEFLKRWKNGECGNGPFPPAPA